MSKPIKMLKPGTFTAMNGKSYTFTEADLEATAAAYDPILFAAPIVKGHPTDDAPAFGRIYAVEFSSFLLGTPGKVDPAFREEVNAGRYDQVSLSLYPPDHPSNPVPGVYYPRHLGFLGAMPPAVKGLGTVSLSEAEEGFIYFAEMDVKEPAPKKENKNMAVKDRASFCGDCSENVCIPTCPVDAITMTPDKGAVIDPAKCTVCYKCIDACRMMCDPVYGMQVANYSEAVKEKDATIASLTAERDTARTDLVAEKTESRRKEFSDFCDAHPTKISPAMRGTVISMMMKLHGQDPIEFGEGPNKVKKTPLEVYQEELQAAPDVCSFSEVADKKKVPEKKQRRTDLPDFGENADEARLDLHSRIIDFMEANPGKSYEQSLDIVQKH